jgi:hypothetical protein
MRYATLALTLLLAACGGGGDDDPQLGAPQPAPAVAPPALPPELPQTPSPLDTGRSLRDLVKQATGR